MPAGIKIEGEADPVGLSRTQPVAAAQAAAAAAAARAAAAAVAASQQQQAVQAADQQRHQEQEQPSSAGGLRKSHSALELGAWRKVAAGELDAFVSPSTREQLLHLEGLNNLGRLTPAERLQKILRYRAKRQMRNFNPPIKYQCRKSLADTRPRVRGRFARDNEPGSVMPHETKKALREGAKGEGNAVAAEQEGGGSGGGAAGASGGFANPPAT